MPNIDLVTMMYDLLDVLVPNHRVKVNLSVLSSWQLIISVIARSGHDRRYGIDATKIEAELGWLLQLGVKEGLRATMEWYLTNHAWSLQLYSQVAGVL